MFSAARLERGQSLGVQSKGKRGYGEQRLEGKGRGGNREPGGVGSREDGRKGRAEAGRKKEGEWKGGLRLGVGQVSF